MKKHGAASKHIYNQVRYPTNPSQGCVDEDIQVACLDVPFDTRVLYLNGYEGYIPPSLGNPIYNDYSDDESYCSPTLNDDYFDDEN